MNPEHTQPRPPKLAGLLIVLTLALLGCSPALPETPSSPSSPVTRPASPKPTPTPTPTPRPLTMQDLAPGLQPAQSVFTQPSSAVATPSAPVSLDATLIFPTGRWTPQNIGLSFEVTDLADRSWDPTVGTLDELLMALEKPALRFGGNTLDREMFWTSQNEPAPAWATVTLTPADFDRLALTVKKVDATVTLALDLGHADAARAADMAFHAHRALGEHLIGVSIGNEPNGFPARGIRPADWGPEDFIAEATSYVQAVHDRVPGLPIIGPGTFEPKWWRAFAGAQFPNTVALTQHWYPLWSCDGVKEPRAAPLASNLASPWLHDRATFILGMGAQSSRTAGLPLWVEETGPTSCAGSNESSRTHAQTLWTVDYSLHAAGLGVVRLNHHSSLGGCKGGAPMSAVCDTDSRPDQDFIRGRSNYLALLFLAQARNGEISAIPVSGDAAVFAYAIRDAAGLDVVIVNMNDPATAGPAPLTLAPPIGLRLTQISQLNGVGLAAVDASQLIPFSAAPEAGLLELNAGSATLLRFEN